MTIFFYLRASCFPRIGKFYKNGYFNLFCVIPARNSYYLLYGLLCIFHQHHHIFIFYIGITFMTIIYTIDSFLLFLFIIIHCHCCYFMVTWLCRVKLLKSDKIIKITYGRVIGHPPKTPLKSSRWVFLNVMFCTIWYHLRNLKRKNTHWGKLLLVKLQAL